MMHKEGKEAACTCILTVLCKMGKNCIGTNCSSCHKGEKLGNIKFQKRSNINTFMNEVQQ